MKARPSPWISAVTPWLFTACVSECAGFRNFKCRRIEHLIRQVTVLFRISDQVRAVRTACAGLTVVDAQVWRERLTGLENRDTSNLPVRQHEMADRRKILEKSAIPSNGQVVEITQAETVADIKIRQAPFTAKIRNVLETSSRRTAASTIVDRFGPGVGRKERQTVRRPLFHAELSGLVVRSCTRFVNIHLTDGRVGPADTSNLPDKLGSRRLD